MDKGLWHQPPLPLRPALSDPPTSLASGCPSTPRSVCESPAGPLTVLTPQLNMATLQASFCL